MVVFASSFNQDLSSWNVGNVTTMEGMFTDVTLSISIYYGKLNGWSALSSLQNGVTFDAGNGRYSSNSTNTRQHIIDTYNWTINDNRQTTTGKAYALNDGSKAIIDETPEVASNNRTYQTSEDNWITQSEENLLGYNIYRNTQDNTENSIKVNPQIIEATNTSSYHTYNFTDESLTDPGKYYYWLECTEYSGNSTLFGPVSIVINDTPDNPDVPQIVNYGLRNYPNPFNPSTTIQYAVKVGGKATLYIYNIKGQLVKKANCGVLQADKTYEYIWSGTDMNGRNVGSGVF